MAGPWEKYQNKSSSPSEEGPWSRFQAPEGASESVGLTKEEAAPVSAWDRAIVKNLSNDPGAASAYLAKKYPDLEVQFDNNRYLLRNKNKDEPFKVLDPDTGINLSSLSGLQEFGKDIGDIAYDIPAGIASTGAGIAGGLAGGLPGSMAATGAAESGLEFGRQQLGKLAGIPQDTDYGQVGLAGATGAMIPALFGSGASAANVAAAATRKGLAKEGAQALMRSQRGLLTRGSGSVLPRLGQAMSGIDKRTLNYAYRNMPALQKMEQGGITEGLEALRQQAKNKIQKQAMSVGQEMGDILTNYQDKISIEEAKKILTQNISELKKRSPTQANQEALSGAQAEFDRIFGINKKQQASKLLNAQGFPVTPAKSGIKYLPHEVSATEARQLESELKSLADLDKPSTKDIQNRFAGKAYSASEKQFSEKAREAKNSITNELDKIEAFSEAKGQYKNISQDREFVQKTLGDPEKIDRLLGGVDKRSNQIKLEKIQKIDSKYGTNLLGKAQELNAYNFLRNPALLPISSNAVTATLRGVPLAAAGGLVGWTAGLQSGIPGGAPVLGGLGAGAGALMGGPAAMRFYLQGIRSGMKGAKAARYAVQPAWNLLKGYERVSGSPYRFNFEENK